MDNPRSYLIRRTAFSAQKRYQALPKSTNFERTRPRKLPRWPRSSSSRRSVPERASDGSATNLSNNEKASKPDNLKELVADTTGRYDRYWRKYWKSVKILEFLHVTAPLWNQIVLITELVNGKTRPRRKVKQNVVEKDDSVNISAQEPENEYRYHDTLAVQEGDLQSELGAWLASDTFSEPPADLPRHCPMDAFSETSNEERKPAAFRRAKSHAGDFRSSEAETALQPIISTIIADNENDKQRHVSTLRERLEDFRDAPLPDMAPTFRRNESDSLSPSTTVGTATEIDLEKDLDEIKTELKDYAQQIQDIAEQAETETPDLEEMRYNNGARVSLDTSPEMNIRTGIKKSPTMPVFPKPRITYNLPRKKILDWVHETGPALSVSEDSQVEYISDTLSEAGDTAPRGTWPPNGLHKYLRKNFSHVSLQESSIKASAQSDISKPRIVTEDTTAVTIEKKVQPLSPIIEQRHTRAVSKEQRQESPAPLSSQPSMAQPSACLSYSRSVLPLHSNRLNHILQDSFANDANWKNLLKDLPPQFEGLTWYRDSWTLEIYKFNTQYLNTIPLWIANCPVIISYVPNDGLEGMFERKSDPREDNPIDPYKPLNDDEVIQIFQEFPKAYQICIFLNHRMTLLYKEHPTEKDYLKAPRTYGGLWLSLIHKHSEPTCSSARILLERGGRNVWNDAPVQTLTAVRNWWSTKRMVKPLDEHHTIQVGLRLRKIRNVAEQESATAMTLATHSLLGIRRECRDNATVDSLVESVTVSNISEGKEYSTHPQIGIVKKSYDSESETKRKYLLAGGDFSFDYDLTLIAPLKGNERLFPYLVVRDLNGIPQRMTWLRDPDCFNEGKTEAMVLLGADPYAKKGSHSIETPSWRGGIFAKPNTVANLEEAAVSEVDSSSTSLSISKKISAESGFATAGLEVPAKSIQPISIADAEGERAPEASSSHTLVGSFLGRGYTRNYKEPSLIAKVQERRVLFSRSVLWRPDLTNECLQGDASNRGGQNEGKFSGSPLAIRRGDSYHVFGFQNYRVVAPPPDVFEQRLVNLEEGISPDERKARARKLLRQLDDLAFSFYGSLLLPEEVIDDYVIDWEAPDDLDSEVDTKLQLNTQQDLNGRFERLKRLGRIFRRK